MDFEKAKKEMIEFQLKARGISSPVVLEAMEKVPRHLFVPEDSQNYAYEDHPLGIGYGQTISQPYMVALMTELLDLKPKDKVLEIGTGSGYQTAILAEIVEKVITIERIKELANSAKERLEKLGYKNVTVILGDGTLGYEKEAPYDAILVTAGSPDVPDTLKMQLKDCGRLVIPVGSTSLQFLLRIIRNGDKFITEKHTSCMFVPLIGEKGWRFFSDN